MKTGYVYHKPASSPQAPPPSLGSRQARISFTGSFFLT